MEIMDIDAGGGIGREVRLGRNGYTYTVLSEEVGEVDEMFQADFDWHVSMNEGLRR